MSGKIVRHALAVPFLFWALEGHAAATAESSIENLTFRTIDLTPGDGNPAGWVLHNGNSSPANTNSILSFSIPYPYSSDPPVTEQGYMPGFLKTLPLQTLQNSLGSATTSTTHNSLHAKAEGMGLSNWQASADTSTGYFGPGYLAIEILPYTAFGISATLMVSASDSGAELNGVQDWGYAAASIAYFGDYADTVELSVSTLEDGQPTSIANQRLFDIVLTNSSNTSKLLYFTAQSTAVVRAVPEPQSVLLAAAGALLVLNHLRKQRKHARLLAH